MCVSNLDRFTRVWAKLVINMLYIMGHVVCDLSFLIKPYVEPAGEELDL